MGVLQVERSGKSICSSFSVLMSVYAKEDPENLKEAFLSVVDQTRKDFELVLVKDGPLPIPLESEIQLVQNKVKVVVISLSHNMGLADALDIGLSYCTHDLVVRCDSDDLNHSQRFALLIGCMEKNPQVDVLGSQILEFDSSSTTYVPIKSRKVPLNDSNIKKYAVSKCPVNHPSVCYRKKEIVRLGGYSSQNIRSMEDYALWVSAIGAGLTFQNLEDILVFYRSGSNMYARRVGSSYAKDEIKLFKLKLRSCDHTLRLYLVSFARIALRLVPPLLSKYVYRFFTGRKVCAYNETQSSLKGLPVGLLGRFRCVGS